MAEGVLCCRGSGQDETGHAHDGCEQYKRPKRGRWRQREAQLCWVVGLGWGGGAAWLGGLLDSQTLSSETCVSGLPCCTLLMNGGGGGLQTEKGQNRRAGSGRTASLELEMAAHYDIPTTLRNGASFVIDTGLPMRTKIAAFENRTTAYLQRDA